MFSRLRPDEEASKTVHPQDTPDPEAQRDKGGPPPSVVNPIANAPDAQNNRKSNPPLWEIATVLVAFGLLVVNILLWCSTKKAADAAKESADTARKELELSERPWVSVSMPVATDPLTTDSKGQVSTAIHIEIKNVGRTPAKGVMPVQVPFIFTTGITDQILNEMCSHKVEYEPLGQTVFPNERTPDASYSVAGQATQLAPNMFGVGTASIVGCIIYKSFISDETYYTGFRYKVLVKVGNTPIMRFQFKDDGTIVTSPVTEIKSTDNSLVIQKFGIVFYQLDGPIMK